jgi:protocatechuate 3,4-dioxygenase beta subunit
VIEGYIWQDRNGNGQRDPGEGIAGVEVTLVGVGTMVTDEDGHFAFTGVTSGNYTVEAHDPLGRYPDTSTTVDASAGDPPPQDVEYCVLALPLVFR